MTIADDQFENNNKEAAELSLECFLIDLPWPDQSVLALAMGNDFQQFSQLWTHRLQPVFQIQICC